MPRYGKRLSAAAALEGLANAKRIRQSARERRQIARRARPAMQDDHQRSRLAVRPNPHHEEMLLQFSARL